VLDRIEVDVVDVPFGEIDGKELATARSEVTAVIRHGGCREVMGFRKGHPTRLE
jgi:hypothetical protein